MNHNDYDLKNIIYRTKINNFQNDSIKNRNKFSSLFNMKKAYNNNTGKNLNLEYFKNIYKQNENKQAEAFVNKKNNFNDMKNDIYGYSRCLNERNLNNNQHDYNQSKKRRSFFNDYFNEDIKYMNMKIDLRIIEHKLNCLLNIYSPDEIYSPKQNKVNYENNFSPDNINNENNYYEENKYSPINIKKNHSIEIENNMNNNNDHNQYQDQDINYDNNSVNGQKIEMAIENVVSFNNVQDSNEQNENNKNDNNKSVKIKKDNIIHLLNDKNDKSKNDEQNKEIINKENLENINTNNIKINPDNKINLNNIDNLISETNENIEIEALKNNYINNINNNNQNNDNNDNNDNDKKDEVEEDNEQMKPERDYNIEIENENNKNNYQQNKEKKVHFDDKLVYINYDQDEYITELEITDQNGKILPYKEKDFTKYLRLLTSVSNNNKPPSSLAKTHKKRKKKKKTKIMERNMEFIKQVEKTGNIYGNMKEYEKKPPNSESKNCRKFMENPQHFFTEDLCDIMLLQYDINPKDHLNASSNTSFIKKYKDKK